MPVSQDWEGSDQSTCGGHPHTVGVHLATDSSFFLCLLQPNKPSKLLSPPFSQAQQKAESQKNVKVY